MRLVITENISLDGVTEQSDRTGEWFSPASGAADTPDLDEAMRQSQGAR